MGPKTSDLKLIAKDDLYILVKQDYIIDVNRNIMKNIGSKRRCC